MSTNFLYKIWAWSGLASESNSPDQNESGWELLPMELWWEILKQVEVSSRSWPERRDFVSAAGVCRSWRQMCKEIVSPPELFPSLTFPTSVKQRVPRNGCIRWVLHQAKQMVHEVFLFSGDDEYKNGKFLLAAHRSMYFWTCHNVIISTDVKGRSCLGKLRSNHEETEFSLYDHSSSFPEPTVCSKIAKIVYDKTPPNEQHPQLRCTMYSIPASSVQGKGRETGPFTMDDSNPCTEEMCSCQRRLYLGGTSERGTFEMSYGYPLCALKAFGICLTILQTDTL